MKSLLKIISWSIMIATPSLWAVVADSTAHPDSLHPGPVGKKAWAVVQHDSLRRFSSVVLDSSRLQRSAYGSLGDVLSELAGVYVFDRGSVGQLSLAALHSASYRHVDASWSGLLLNDPVTGLADLNLAPVQAVQQASIMPEPYEPGDGTLAPGFALQITDRDLVTAALRSAVAYRTGANGYDDIDVRLGLKLSKNSGLNLGGVLKNYSGTMVAVEKYRAQKINLTIDRDLGSSWCLRYLLLLNKMDRNLPWSATYWPATDQLHEKQDRYDHGFILRHQRVTLMWQYTDLYRELYNYPDHVRQIQEAGRSRLSLSSAGSLGPVFWQVGGLWQYTAGQVRDFAKQRRHDFDLWTRVRSSANSVWFWQAGLRVNQQGTMDICLLPELQFRPPVWRGWHSWLWYGSHVSAAGMAGAYNSESFYYGQRIVQQAKSRMAGLMVEKQWRGSRFFISGSYADEEIEWSTSAGSFMPSHDDRVVVDCAWQQELISHFSFYLKQRSGRSIERLCTWGYLQYHNLFFSGDLDVQLRIGASQIFLDEQSSYTGFGPTRWIPYAHAGFKIKDVYLFFSLQNFLSVNYELVAGYLMPKQQFRWGFVWNFYN